MSKKGTNSLFPDQPGTAQPWNLGTWFTQPAKGRKIKEGGPNNHQLMQTTHALDSSETRKQPEVFGTVPRLLWGDDHGMRFPNLGFCDGICGFSYVLSLVPSSSQFYFEECLFSKFSPDGNSGKVILVKHSDYRSCKGCLSLCGFFPLMPEPSFVLFLDIFFKLAFKLPLSLSWSVILKPNHFESQITKKI